MLLSNDDRYIEACRSAITRLRPSTRRINSVAYGDAQVTWVHIIHVGGPGKNHIADWFAGNGTQGRKRTEAQEAVSSALGQPLGRSAEIGEDTGPVRETFEDDEKATEHPRNVKGEGRPIPENKARDSILARIEARRDIQPHPDQADLHGTKYIAAFVTPSGVVFAVDKMSASKQPIWFPDTRTMRSQLESAGTAFEYYPPERGRNSNLHKLPGFKSGALLRTYPETVDEAMHIVDLLCTWGI